MQFYIYNLIGTQHYNSEVNLFIKVYNPAIPWSEHVRNITTAVYYVAVLQVTLLFHVVCLNVDLSVRPSVRPFCAFSKLKAFRQLTWHEGYSYRMCRVQLAEQIWGQRSRSLDHKKCTVTKEYVNLFINTVVVQNRCDISS